MLGNRWSLSGEFAACVAIVALFFAVACQSSPQSHPEPEPESPPQSVETTESEEAPVQEPGPSQTEADEELEALAARVSDEDLEMFAAAVRAVSQRQAQLEAEQRDLDTLMAEATTPGERVAAEQEILAEMQDAVESKGVDYDAFMTMGQIIRQHTGLQERLGQYLDDREIEAFFVGE